MVFPHLTKARYIMNSNAKTGKLSDRHTKWFRDKVGKAWFQMTWENPFASLFKVRGNA